MEEDPRRRSALRGRRREHHRRARRSKVRRRRVYEGGARGEEKERDDSFLPRGPTSHGTNPTPVQAMPTAALGVASSAYTSLGTAPLSVDVAIALGADQVGPTMSR